MRLVELAEDYADIANIPGRPPDTRPTVGDRRMYTGIGGVIEKQAKRLKHINDELNDVDFDTVIKKSQTWR